MLVHLARPNPVWPHLDAAAEVRLAVIGDYAYIPTYWQAKHRERVVGHLEQRGRGLDAGAATQQGRRLAAIGDWQTRRGRP